MDNLNYIVPTEKHFLVLKLLLENGNTNYGKIVELAKSDHARSSGYYVGGKDTVNKALNRLEKTKLIKSFLEKREKKGRPKKFFEVTPLGIMFCLSYFQDLDKNLDIIAERNKKVLPYIFDKWEFYEENNVLDIIKIRFLTSVGMYMRSFNAESVLLQLNIELLKVRNNTLLNELGEILDNESELSEIEIEDDVEKYFLEGIFGFNYLYLISPKSEEIRKDIEFSKQIKLFKAIKKDSDLNILFEQLIIEEIEITTERLDVLNDWKSLLEE